MARRVNKKFLIILTCVIVGGGLALLVAGKLLFRHTPEEFITAGDRYMQSGEYELAIRNYMQAHSMRPGDPAILVQVGDAFEARSVQEPAYIGKERAAWNQALDTKSDYVPAMERLFAIYRDDADAAPRPEVFDRVQSMGKRLLIARPDDVDVKAYVLSIPIRRLSAGIAVSDGEIDSAMSGLEAMRQKDPALAEPPFWIAQAKVFRAIDRQRSGYGQEASKLLDEAAALFDVANGEQAKNAALHLRAYQLFTALARMESQPERQQAMLNRAKSEIDRAREVVQSDDPKFVDIYLSAAQQALGTKDNVGAEKILRDLMAKRPDDQPTRVMLAKLLGSQPEKRKEAIELLSQPVKPADRAYKTRQYELATLIEQTSLRLDAYPTITDGAEREAAGKTIVANLDRVDNWLRDSTESLRLRGRWSMLQGNVTDAIQQLNRAVNLLAQNNRPKDYDLMFQLARAYAAGNQTGDAKKLLKEIVDRFPTFPAARLLLAQLLLRENAIAEVQQQVDELEKLIPGADEVQRLRMAVFKASNQGDQAKALYDKMPESTDAERRAKAQIAIALGEYKDGARLLEMLHAQSPDDLGVIRLLVQVCVAINEKDRASALVDKALAAHPGDAQLVLLQKSLHDASPSELIDQIPDEFTRELRRHDLAVAQHDDAKALTHLQNAEKLKPDDTQVLNLLFQHYLQAKDWSAAQGYMDRLIKLDADHAKGQTYRFRFAMAQGKIDEAIAIARDLTSDMGEFSQSWQLLGQALQAAGWYDEAVSRYAMAIEKQSENLDAYRGIIQCYYALNQPAGAARYIEQGRRVFPNDAGLAELQVQYDLNYGDLDKAIAARQAALTARPQDPQAWLNAGQAYVRAAQVLAGRNDAAGAQKWADKAQALFVEAVTKWPDEPQFYAYRAEMALATGKAQDGLDALNALAGREKWKDRPEPQSMLGEYYARIGKVDEAEKAFRAAMQLSHNAVDVQLKLISLLTQTGKIDQALEVMKINADDPNIVTQRISVLMGAQRFAEAEKIVTDALAKKPNDAELNKNLAAIYLNTNRKEQAITALKTVLDQNPNDPLALRLMGMIHLMDNQPDEATAVLSKVRDRQPNDVDARYYLAKAYQQKNQLDSATRELEAALKVQPQNKILRMELINVNSNLRRWSEVERLIADARQMSIYAKDSDWPQSEAMMWLARGDGDKAIAAIQQAIALSPNDVQLVQQYFDILLAGRANQRVLDETDKILAANQKPWWVYQYRGIAFRRLDKKEEALAAFTQALTDPQVAGNTELSTRIAQVIAREMGVNETLAMLKDRIEKETHWQLFAIFLYQATGDLTNAARLLEPLMDRFDKLSPQEQDSVLRFTGLVYSVNPTPEGLNKAHDAYVRLLKKYPDDLTALNNMACLLVDQMSRPQQAMVYSQQAYNLMQKTGQIQPLVLDTYAWNLIQVGRVEEGIAILRQALDRQRFVEGYYHLAIAYLKQKNPQQARDQLALATQMLEQAEKNKQTVDPVLKQRIAEASSQADAMMKDKG